MKRNKLIWLLVLIAIVMFPFDPSILLNRVLGMNNHIIVYIIFIAVILYLIRGNGISEKWSNFKRELRRGLK